MKTFCLSAGLFILSAFCAFAAGPPFAAILRNDITTNSFFGGITAGQVPIWDAVNGRFTNGAVSATATNAISDINGSSSNHQYIVLWSATETSNTFGIQTATGAGGATNFFHLPTADATHSGMISSADWIQFNNITATNFNANQFTLSSKIVAIKVGALTTNGIVWVTNFNASLYQQPHWSSAPTASDRPQLVTSNGIPMLTARYTNDSAGGLHSILYIGGGNTVNDADKRFEGIHMEFPNILDLNSDSNYVGMAMNFNDVFAYGMHQYRFLLEDPAGTSGQINYDAITTDPLFTSINYGDAFTATRLRGKDMLFATTVRSFGISNVVINQSASSTANALAKFAGTGGNIVQTSSLIALSDNSLYVPGTLTNLGHVFSGTVVTNTFLYLGSGGVVITGAFSTGLTFSGGILTASAGAPSVQTNSVAVGSQGTINLIAGSGISFLATNNGGASKVDVQIISSGGSANLTTNANQFGPSVTLTLKDGMLVTNVNTFGVSNLTTVVYQPKVLAAVGGGTNLYADGSLGNLFTNALNANGNLIFTNLNDGQPVEAWLFVSNGVTAQIWSMGGLAPLASFPDGNNVLVSNSWNYVRAQRMGVTTNFWAINKGYDLDAGANVTFTTNYATGKITIASSGGGNLSTNANQFGASTTLTIKDGVIVTNLDVFTGLTMEPQVGLSNVLFSQNGKIDGTNDLKFDRGQRAVILKTSGTGGLTGSGYMVTDGIATNYFSATSLGRIDTTGTLNVNMGAFVPVSFTSNSLTVLGQVLYVAQEYNGSNTVNDYAWDMSLNTFKPITNFVNTNMVFTLSNITKSASLISEWIGNPGTTNTILIKAVSGANIKWKGWNTNVNSGGILVRGGYSYTFQAFADRTTNVSAWVTTDDPYAVGPIISIVTNDLVINTRYTNTASTVSYVQCSMTLNASVTDIAQAVLLIDQNGDGTFDTWITNRIGSGVAMADSILMGGWVTNSGIFLITNQSTGSATATINPNSSQRISGFGTGPQGLTGATGATGAAGTSPVVSAQYKTANYTVLTNDTTVLMDAASGILTNTLPSATNSAGLFITIKKVDESTNLVVINPLGTETIDGIAVWVLSYQDQYITLGSSATNWYVVNKSPLDGSFWLNTDIGLEEWRASIASMRSRTNAGPQINVNVVGDSITEGSLASADTGTRFTNGYCGKLNALMQADVVTNGIGFIAAWRSTSSYTNIVITRTGSWSTGAPSDGAGGGPFNKSMYATGTNNFLDVTNVQMIGSGAGFYVYYHENTFTVTGTNYVELVDATQTNVLGSIDTATSTPTVYKRKFFATNMTSIVTLRVHAPNLNYLMFDGIQPVTTTNGVFVNNIGFAGSKVADYSIGSGASDWTNSGRWATPTMAPALTIVQLDSNDASVGTASAAYKTNLANLIIEARKTGSVLLVGSLTRSSASAGVQEGLQNVERELAMKYKCAFVSIKRNWGDNNRQTAMGLTTDGTHPTLTGHERMAKIIWDKIKQ